MANKTTVSINPNDMSDSVADWPLSRVVAHLRAKEKADPAASDISRITCRSSIKLLTPALEEMASLQGASRGRMSRWVSYHAIAIARDDPTVKELAKLYSGIRRQALVADDADAIDILKSLLSYTPRQVDEDLTEFRLYDSWVKSEFQELADVCGVYIYRIVQIYMVRSMLSELYGVLDGVSERFRQESERWDKWMQVRLAALKQLAEEVKF